MKKLSFVLSFVLFIFFAVDSNASKIWYRQALTGNTATSLDGIRGDNASDADLGMIANGTNIYFYKYDADSGAVENSPNVITPDTAGGSAAWLLQSVYSVVSGTQPPTGVDMTGGIVGMIPSNSVDTEHDISISPGACMDNTGIYHLSLDSAIVKRIDSTWVVGTGAGGLLNGSVMASELYNIYILRNDSDGLVDVGFIDKDDDIDNYLPSGYSSYRWVGFVRTDSSANIIQFLMTNNEYIYEVAPAAATGLGPISGYHLSLSSVAPGGRATKVLVSGYKLGGSGSVLDFYTYPGTFGVFAETVVSTRNAYEFSQASISTYTPQVSVPVRLDGTIMIGFNDTGLSIFVKSVEVVR